jgi:predicted ATPase
MRSAPVGQSEKVLPPSELKSSALSPHLKLTPTNGSVIGSFFSAESFRGWAEFLDDVARIDPGRAKYHGEAELTGRSHGEGILAYLGARYRSCCVSWTRTRRAERRSS